jgi:hypothetical protein
MYWHVHGRLQKQKKGLSDSMQELQEALVGPGTLFTHKGTPYKVVNASSATNGTWSCTPDHPRPGSTKQRDIIVGTTDVVAGINA